MFTGDSITDCHRRDVEDQPLGYGYPLFVSALWGLAHPDRPITWLNTGVSGDRTSMDLEPRWQRDVVAARPDVVSVLTGINDVVWHTNDPEGRAIPLEEFEASYDRMLDAVVRQGARIILIEPFQIPLEPAHWALRADLDPKIQAVRRLARKYGAELLAADGLFAELSATTDPAHWSADGTHPTPAGHAALARAWMRLVS